MGGMNKQYPNDGKRHPDLSDFWQEIVEAVRPLGTSYSFYFWVFAAIVLWLYPDWGPIVGWGLVLFGLWGTVRLRVSRRSGVE